MLHAIKQILFNIVGINLFFPWLSPFIQNMLSIQQENHFRASENYLYVRTCIPLFSILVNEDLCVVCVFNYVHISWCNPWLSLPQSGNPRLTPCQIQTMQPHPRSLVTSNSGWRWRWFVMELEWKEQQLMGCLITRYRSLVHNTNRDSQIK